MRLSGVYYTLLSVVCTAVLCQEYEIVQTPVGKIRGLVETVGEEKAFTFRGIPFAKPPIGDLRFRKPQPYGSWDYTLDATKDTSPCMQPVDPSGGFQFVTNTRISEDCLFLNIHVPRTVSVSQNRAVMVFIHGGGFFVGQGSWYNGTMLALKGDVIVVTINYRLGIFGFLSTFDDASRGNYGIWDQIMALQWVKSNIASFGGNPSLVTVFGQSAGGACVGYLSLIPYNKGLFKRVIAQSGASNSARLAKDSKPVFDSFSESGYCLDIPSENKHALMNCLRHLSADELQTVSMNFIMKQMMDIDLSMYFGGAFDGDLFKSDPEDILSEKSSDAFDFFQSLDVMAGTTDGEGSPLLTLLPAFAEQYQMNITEGIPTKVLCDLLSSKMTAFYYDNVTGVAEAICKKYSVSESEEDYLGKQGAQTCNMYGDIMFVQPAVKTCEAHVNPARKTYNYIFTRYFSHAVGMELPPWFKMSGHGMELLYLFGLDEMSVKFNVTISDEDYRLENDMIKYWSNFAKYGNPNDESLPSWEEYGSSKAYQQLDLHITSGSDVFSDRMDFFRKDVSGMLKKATEKQRDEL